MARKEQRWFSILLAGVALWSIGTELAKCEEATLGNDGYDEWSEEEYDGYENDERGLAVTPSTMPPPPPPFTIFSPGMRVPSGVSEGEVPHPQVICDSDGPIAGTQSACIREYLRGTVCPFLNDNDVVSECNCVFRLTEQRDEICSPVDVDIHDCFCENESCFDVIIRTFSEFPTLVECSGLDRPGDAGQKLLPSVLVGAVALPMLWG